MTLLADGRSPVYPCHVPSAQMRQHPIGTGPFKFVEFKPTRSIKVARNPVIRRSPPGTPVAFVIAQDARRGDLCLATIRNPGNIAWYFAADVCGGKWSRGTGGTPRYDRIRATGILPRPDAEALRRGGIDAVKALDLGPYEAFHERLLGRRHDYLIDGFKANPKALEYFERLSIDAADLAVVEWLNLDGGNPIFQYIDPNWQGYTEGVSEIQRLDDIALLPNLLYFGAAAFLPKLVDFSLFRPLAKLTRLNATIDEYSNLDTLTALPALTQLELMGNRIYDDVTIVGHPARKVMDILRARGVKLAVTYVSRSYLPGQAPPPAFH